MVVHVHMPAKAQTYKKMDRCNKKELITYKKKSVKYQIKAEVKFGTKNNKHNKSTKGFRKNTDGKTAAWCTLMDGGEEIRIAKGVWVLDRLPALISKGPLQ